MAGARGVKTAAQRAIETFEAAQKQAPDLIPEAVALFSANGWLNAMARLKVGFENGGGRDEIAAMNGEFKVLKEIGIFISKLMEFQSDERLSKAGEELTRKMSQKGMSSGTSFDGFNPPTEPPQGGH